MPIGSRTPLRRSGIGPVTGGDADTQAWESSAGAFQPTSPYANLPVNMTPAGALRLPNYTAAVELAATEENTFSSGAESIDRSNYFVNVQPASGGTTWNGVATPTDGDAHLLVIKTSGVTATDTLTIAASAGPGSGVGWVLPNGADITLAEDHWLIFAFNQSGYELIAPPLPIDTSYAPATAAQVNVYETADSPATWTKPTGAKVVTATLLGPGGGGGSGRRVASGSNGYGGSGGGGGAYNSKTFHAGQLPASVTVTIPAGGAGGAAQTSDDTNGNAGTAGGVTSFGGFLKAGGGAGGGGGSTSSPSIARGGSLVTSGSGSTAGLPRADAGEASDWAPSGFAPQSTQNNAGRAGIDTGGVAGNPSVSGGGAGEAGGSSVFGGGGGGPGGGVNTVPVRADPAAGGGTGTFQVGGGGAAGTSHATAPTAGTDGADGATAETGYGGEGGGGGGSATAAAAANGGAGGNYGGGGGGGGASINGNNSGAGGAGGDGLAVVITLF